MESVSREVGVCLVSSETARTFPKVVTPFYITHQRVPPSCSVCCWVFVMFAILVGAQWYLLVVLICVSLTANDVEHLFRCLLAICVFFVFGQVFIPVACPLSLCYVFA